MPIPPFLNGERFDLEGERVLRVAFEMVCLGLRTGDCDDHVKQAIATKLIALAKTGERNPRYFVRRGIEGHSHAPTVDRLRSCAVFGIKRSHLRAVSHEHGTAGKRFLAGPGLSAWLRHPVFSPLSQPRCAMRNPYRWSVGRLDSGEISIDRLLDRRTAR